MLLQHQTSPVALLSYHFIKPVIIFCHLPPQKCNLLDSLCCPMYSYSLPVVKHNFFSDTETGDACLCSSEGGETVSHPNTIRQLCVCLLAISCGLGHSDIGSCLLQFLSLELREDLTLCLPDTETSHPHWPLSGP